MAIVTRLFLLAFYFAYAAYAAMSEGNRYDGFHFSANMAPPLLGFRWWTQIGNGLAVFAAGIFIAALIVAIRHDETEFGYVKILHAQAHPPSSERDHQSCEGKRSS